MGFDSFLTILLFVPIVLLIISMIASTYEYNPYKALNRRAKERADKKFYRFNPNRLRETIVKVTEDIVHLETDIQDIQVYSGTLIVKVSSELRYLPLKFKLAIKPFSLPLFDMEEFISFNSDGMLLIGSEEPGLKATLEANDDVREIGNLIIDEPRTTYLYTSWFSVDNTDKALEFNGAFDDQNEFKIRIEYEAFKLKITAPMASLKNKLNFGDFDLLETL